jgi:hypothetical protein
LIHSAGSRYAAGLAPELARLIDLRVFDRIPSRFDPHEFSALVYLIGNTPADLEIYDAALRHPGIVVLNGPDLHDLVRLATQGQPEKYFGEVFYEIFGQEWDTSRDTGLDVTGHFLCSGAFSTAAQAALCLAATPKAQCA